MSESEWTLAPDDRQRLLLCLEATERELRQASEVPRGANELNGIHRHLAQAADWVTEARKLLNAAVVQTNMPSSADRTGSMTDSELCKQMERTAYHEAGHAVAAHLLHRRLGQTSIVPLADSLGRCTFGMGDFERIVHRQAERDVRPADLRRLYREMVATLAGAAATERVAGKLELAGSRDLELSQETAVVLAASREQREALSASALKDARQLLHDSANWAAVQAIATELLQQRTIKAPRARQIIRDAMRRQSRARS
jgi:hypothetical protein